MNTDLKAHTGHNLEYQEQVGTPWSVKWVKDSSGYYPELGEIISHKSHVVSSELYCKTCDLYLTGYEEVL